MEKTVSIQALQRIPLYLNYLKSLSPPDGNVSAKAIADALGFGEIQVRKDLAAVSGGGRPKVGYRIGSLVRDINAFMGYDDVNDAVLVGAGKLGRALMSYGGFQQYGMNIVTAFDADPAQCGRDGSGKEVFPVEKLPDLVSRMNIRIGIIAVPGAAAQAVCDELVAAGILAVWNFAPVHLAAPEGILIKSENMAASLALLSKHLQDAMGGYKEAEKK